MPHVTVRDEAAADHATVRAVNAAAFETQAEARLVDILRSTVAPLVSLVAEVDGAVVGHILFSPVSIREHAELRLMGLAPMAIAPDHQRSGLGSALVREGLDRCRQLGCHAVVVLGHPHYYPKFGFVPSVKFGIRSEYDVPDGVFMLLELEPGVLHGATGVVRYNAAFAGV